ncbi:hypothetical protein [Bacillus sp. Bva_UNVM-123]|uniref:hypothetical protein n=1 Tax=Bacillus sp. Bva_UNVM-123 TaxID=2829798 RepID=UPI00391F59AB
MLNAETAHEIVSRQLTNELKRIKRIKVPNIDYSISGEELADWLIDISTPEEIEETLLMIQNAKKRGSNINSLLQTIAVALLY